MGDFAMYYKGYKGLCLKDFLAFKGLPAPATVAGVFLFKSVNFQI